MSERAHHTRGYDCWCNPVITHPCPNCEAISHYTNQGGCWSCGGEGFTVCDAPSECDGNHVVCHRYPKGTPGACYFLEGGPR